MELQAPVPSGVLPQGLGLATTTTTSTFLQRGTFLRIVSSSSASSATARAPRAEVAELVRLQGAVPGLVGSVGAEHGALVLLLEALDLVLHRLHHVDRVDGQLQQLLHGSHLEEPDTKEELRKGTQPRSRRRSQCRSQRGIQKSPMRIPMRKPTRNQQGAEGNLEDATRSAAGRGSKEVTDHLLLLRSERVRSERERKTASVGK